MTVKRIALLITAALLFGCAGIPGKTAASSGGYEEKSVSGIDPGLYEGEGWGRIHIVREGNSYVGSYGPGNASVILLWKEGNVWKGMWEEPDTGRGGLLTGITVKSGRIISGWFTESKTGDGNGEDGISFIWRFVR